VLVNHIFLYPIGGGMLRHQIFYFFGNSRVGLQEWRFMLYAFVHLHFVFCLCEIAPSIFQAYCHHS